MSQEFPEELSVTVALDGPTIKVEAQNAEAIIELAGEPLIGPGSADSDANIDGGGPGSVYGGLPVIDGGGV